VTRSPLLLAIAAVLAGTAALFVVLGAVFNLLLAVAALPFGAAAYFLWSHATGRLRGRIRRRFAGREEFEHRQATADPGRRSQTGRRHRTGRRTANEEGQAAMDREAALNALDVAPDADAGTIRRAYRDRVKAVHPDADGGDEDEFRRVRAAYERLTDPERGKG
jgi:hypothetical protein